MATLYIRHLKTYDCYVPDSQTGKGFDPDQEAMFAHVCPHGHIQLAGVFLPKLLAVAKAHGWQVSIRVQEEKFVVEKTYGYVREANEAHEG